MGSTFHSEPTEPAYSNPYYHNPYDQIPPPPPRKSHWLYILLVLSLLAILGSIVFSETYLRPSVTHLLRHVSIPSPTSAPSPIPTPTPEPSIKPVPTAPPPQPTTAYSLYQNIVKSLDSHHVVSMKGYDTKWSGWPYTPERNAILFTDTTPDGTYTVEIAVFNSPNEAQTDYQCQNDNKCSKLSYQGNNLQGTYHGACLFMDNNYNENGSRYSDYMLDDLQAFNNTAC
jgi:hypothetical protein